MNVVLVDSRRVGSSAWAAVRGSQKVHVSGMQEGDEIEVFTDLSRQAFLFVKDGELTLKTLGTPMRVKVDHVRASGSPVSVDLR